MSRQTDECWHIWIDRGGTFTDVVARSPDGGVVTTKYLSEDPARPGDAAVGAIRELTGAGQGTLPPLAIRMGSTVATNALLERKGEPTLLAITRGFGDALTIGYQDRPDLFARRLDRIAPPHAAVAEIAERMSPEGDVLTPLDEAAARAALQAARDNGLTSIAIGLMHGYAHPAHEARLVRGVGVAVHQPDRDAGEAIVARGLQRGAGGGFVERRQHIALGAHAFGDFGDGGMRRRDAVEPSREEVGAVLIADGERVAEAARYGEQGRFALAFEEGIGRDGAPHADREGGKCALACAGQLADRTHRGVAGARGVFAQIFGGDDAAVGAARDHIGEGAAAVDPDVPALVSLSGHCPASA